MDLQQKTIRLIGDPNERYKEDPVRMLRAIRFSVKLDFKIHADTEAAIKTHTEHLHAVPSARLFEEVLRLFLTGNGGGCYQALKEQGLFDYLFPSIKQCLNGSSKEKIDTFIQQALRNTDERVAQRKPVTPAFLFAAFLWHPLLVYTEKLEQEGKPPLVALEQAMSEVIRAQGKYTAISRRIGKIIREIWFLQYRFPRRYGKRPFRIVEHPRFRAGFDFLVLRGQTNEAPKELIEWWHTFQDADTEKQEQMVNKFKKNPHRRRRVKKNQ